MTEIEETSESAAATKHTVAKPMNSKKSEKSATAKSGKSSAKDNNSNSSSISNLSNYSFELTREEIEKIKRDYDRDPDRIAEDKTLFKDLALEEMRNRQ